MTTASEAGALAKEIDEVLATARATMDEAVKHVEKAEREILRLKAENMRLAQEVLRFREKVVRAAGLDLDVTFDSQRRT